MNNQKKWHRSFSSLQFLCHPREGGDPSSRLPLDSCLRRNDNKGGKL